MTTEGEGRQDRRPRPCRKVRLPGAAVEEKYHRPMRTLMICRRQTWRVMLTWSSLSNRGNRLCP